MKANLVSEKLNFERGGNPLRKLNIGGISFKKDFEPILEMIKKYSELVEKTLNGKKIAIEKALILSYRTNTTIYNPKIQIISISEIRRDGDIIVYGELLDCDNRETVGDEQMRGEHRGKKWEFEILINSDQKILVL